MIEECHKSKENISQGQVKTFSPPWSSHLFCAKTPENPYKAKEKRCVEKMPHLAWLTQPCVHMVLYFWTVNSSINAKNASWIFPSRCLVKLFHPKPQMSMSRSCWSESHDCRSFGICPSRPRCWIDSRRSTTLAKATFTAILPILHFLPLFIPF